VRFFNGKTREIPGGKKEAERMGMLKKEEWGVRLEEKRGALRERGEL